MLDRITWFKPDMKPILDKLAQIDGNSTGNNAALLQRFQALIDSNTAVETRLERMETTMKELERLLTSDSIKRAETESAKVTSAPGWTPPSRKKRQFESDHREKR